MGVNQNKNILQSGKSKKIFYRVQNRKWPILQGVKHYQPLILKIINFY